MRIRRKSSFISASQSSPYSSPPASSSSPPSSASSSSSITTNSLASSIDSSSSTPPNVSPFPSTLAASKRCQGLDLLVKAIHLVTAGSVVGVPYIQRRVVTRRKAALKFNGFIQSRLEVFNEEQEPEKMKNQMQTKTRSMLKKQSRAMGCPSKYQDSVIQPWRPKSSRQRSIKIGGKRGS